MSKSLGNTISPQEVMNKLAQIFYVCGWQHRLHSEMTVRMKSLSATLMLIAGFALARFLLANLNGFDVTTIKFSQEMAALDRWILRRAGFAGELLEAYDAYQFHTVVHKLMNFCSVELGNYYLDIIKDRQYTASRQPSAS